MTISNENKPAPRKRTVKPKVVVTETVIEEVLIEEPVVVAEQEETIESSLGINALSEKEALIEAEKAGVSPALSVSILENRKYIIAGLTALTVVVIFVVGIIAGLSFASGMASDGATQSGTSVVSPEEAVVTELQEAWMDGYKNGFVEGYHANNTGMQPGYVMDTNGNVVPENAPIDGVQILPGTVEGQ